MTRIEGSDRAPQGKYQDLKARQQRLTLSVDGLQTLVNYADEKIATDTAGLRDSVLFHKGEQTRLLEEAQVHGEKVEKIEKDIVEVSAADRSNREDWSAILRPTEDAAIAVKAELNKFDKAADRIKTLENPDVPEAERVDTVEFFVTDQGNEILQELRTAHGEDSAQPASFRAKKEPSEIADEQLGTNGNGGNNKRRLRALARAGDPDAMIQYYVGTEPEEKIHRRLDIYGYGTEEWKSKLDATITDRLERDAEAENPSALLRTVYPERFARVTEDGVPKMLFQPDKR